MPNLGERDWVTGVELFSLLVHKGDKVSLWGVLHWGESLSKGVEGFSVQGLKERYGKLLMKKNQKEK